ncbi:MAG: hypothetical protein Q7J10_07035 [Methanosarcinaceae archaeon]|nr:hypothetical protein [Methanosarcinaceae archaeon]
MKSRKLSTVQFLLKNGTHYSGHAQTDKFTPMPGVHKSFHLTFSTALQNAGEFGVTQKNNIQLPSSITHDKLHYNV